MSLQLIWKDVLLKWFPIIHREELKLKLATLPSCDYKIRKILKVRSTITGERIRHPLKPSIDCTRLKLPKALEPFQKDFYARANKSFEALNSRAYWATRIAHVYSVATLISAYNRILWNNLWAETPKYAPAPTLAMRKVWRIIIYILGHGIKQHYRMYIHTPDDNLCQKMLTFHKKNRFDNFGWQFFYMIQICESTLNFIK